MNQKSIAIVGIFKALFPKAWRQLETKCFPRLFGEKRFYMPPLSGVRALTVEIPNTTGSAGAVLLSALSIRWCFSLFRSASFALSASPIISIGSSSCNLGVSSPSARFCKSAFLASRIMLARGRRSNWRSHKRKRQRVRSPDLSERLRVARRAFCPFQILYGELSKWGLSNNMAQTTGRHIICGKC